MRHLDANLSLAEEEHPSVTQFSSGLVPTNGRGGGGGDPSVFQNQALVTNKDELARQTKVHMYNNKTSERKQQDLQFSRMYQEEKRHSLAPEGNHEVNDDVHAASFIKKSHSRRHTTMSAPASQPTTSVKTGKDDDPVECLTREVSKLSAQVLEIRKHVKAWVRIEHKRQMKAAVKIQKCFKGYLTRRLLRRCSNNLANCIQRYSIDRLHTSSSKYNDKMPELFSYGHIWLESSAAKIQAVARGFLTRRRIWWYRKYSSSAEIVQKCWRGFYVRRKCFLPIQRYCTFYNFGETKSSVNRIHPYLNVVFKQLDSLFESIHQCHRMAEVQDEAIRRLWEQVVRIRQFHHLKPNLSPKYAAQRIQAFYRRRQDEGANQSIFLKKRLLATLKIQRLVRAFLLGSSAKRFLVRHKSAIIIQKHFRKFIVCKQWPIIADKLEIYSLRRRLAALERAFENFIVQKDELFVKR